MVVDLHRVPFDHIVIVIVAAVELGGVLIAERQRVQQQPPDGARDPCLPGAGIVDHLAAASQQMREACLKAGVPKRRYGAHPSRSSTPAKSSPRTVVTCSCPRPAAIR